MLKLTAKDIMNPNVITVSEEMTLCEVASIFNQHMISGAPVLDEKEKLIGVVSLRDIVEASSRKRASATTKERSEFYNLSWEERLSTEDMEGLQLEIDTGLRIKDVMTSIIMCVSEDTPMPEMADTMIGGRIHRLIVTKGGKIQGIVTTMDMLRIIRDHDKKKKTRKTTRRTPKKTK